ncbi:MAG: hypothetical protein ABW049_06650 [Spongiibacteraceae bacterium]
MAFKQGIATFLELSTKPEVQRILLIDGPALMGWVRWRKLEASYSMGIIKAAVEGGIEGGSIRKMPIEPLVHLIQALAQESAQFIAHSKNPKKARADAEDPLCTAIEFNLALYRLRDCGCG